MSTEVITAERPVQRVSTLELFFDLVFVFTITQIARLVSTVHSAGDVGRAHDGDVRQHRRI